MSKLWYLILIICCLSYYNSFSQAYLGIGYNYGYYSYGLRDVQTYMYNFNYSNPTYAKPFEYSNQNNGITIKFDAKAEEIGSEFFFSTKRIVFEAEGIGLDGVNKLTKIKSRFNTFGAGLYFVNKTIITPGITFVFGRYMEFKKEIPIGSSDNIKYEKIFPKGGYFYGSMVYIEVPVFDRESKVGLYLKPYYEFQWQKVILKFTDMNKIYYKLNNVGINATLKIIISNS